MGIDYAIPRITERNPVNTEEKVSELLRKEIEVLSSATGPNMPPFVNVIGRIRLAIISWPKQRTHSHHCRLPTTAQFRSLDQPEKP